MRSSYRHGERVRLWARLAGRIIALLVIVGAGPAVAAPLNVESVRNDPGTDDIVASVAGRVGVGVGNVQRLDLGSQAALGWRAGANFLMLLGRFDFAARARARDGGRFADLTDEAARITLRGHAHLRYGRTLTELLDVESFVQYQGDAFRMLRVRMLLGTGLRFRLVQAEHGSLVVGTSYMLEYEALGTDRFSLLGWAADRPHQLAHRWSSYISASLTHDRISVAVTGYLQPRWDRFSDLRASTETQLRLSFNKFLALVLRTSLLVDLVPPSFCTAPETTPCPGIHRYRVKPVEFSADHSLEINF